MGATLLITVAQWALASVCECVWVLVSACCCEFAGMFLGVYMCGPVFVGEYRHVSRLPMSLETSGRK